MPDGDYRSGFTVNKRCHIISGYRIPVVDDLLSGDDSFFVQLTCLTCDQQHGLLAQSFVEQTTLLGFQFAFAIKDGLRTRWISEVSQNRVDIPGESFLHRAMEHTATTLLQRLPAVMQELFRSLINQDIDGPFQEAVKVYLWSHQLFDSKFKTLFLLDSNSHACVVVPWTGTLLLQRSKAANKVHVTCRRCLCRRQVRSQTYVGSRPRFSFQMA